MEPLAAPHIEKLTPYSPGKPLEELERELGITNAIKLASNESPVGPSPKVVQAIAEHAAEIHRYPDASAFALKRAVAQKHGVAIDEIAVGNGSNELIDLLCRAFLAPATAQRPADHGLAYDPSFVCYVLGFTAAAAPYTLVPLRDGVHMDVAPLLDAVRPETKVVFVAHPNNPTGTYLPRAELASLLERLPRRAIPVIDEAYFEFADATDYVSALTMRALHPRLVVLRTFSKAYGLAGLRVGYMIASPEIVDYVDRVRAPFNVSAIAQLAARVALEDPEHVERYLAMNRTERNRVTAAIAAMRVPVAASQANFVLVDVGRPGREVYDAMLRRGVIVRPMPPPIGAWLRISIGLPAENDRMLAALGEVLGRGAP